ncbi:hypothetical protein Trydic_g16904 [Trypoxylus dichotomus]
MFKAIVFASILAFAIAVPEPKAQPVHLATTYNAPYYSTPYAYSAYAAPYTYSGYSAYPAYSAYPYSAPLIYH